ncbi:MAG: hypothetical protein KBS66_03765 [Eubacterium sp.]|nr:hypothetical protein [Candidatus Colimonas fimequi]
MKIEKTFTNQLNINYRAIIKILGAIIFIVGIAMIIPWVYAELTHNSFDAAAFRKSAPPSIIVGAFLMFHFKSTDAKFRTRDGYFVVALCWIVASFIGAFPYYFSTFTSSFVDAFFESASGFTTTGCTAVANGVLSNSLLLWKALSHWLGGMGILIFVLSILPALGVNGQFIARAEAPGIVFEKMAVRLSDSTRVLYTTYIALTVAEYIFLVVSPKVGWFDALVNSMGSISTGGLLVHPEGVSYYDSFYIEIVISIFCILASINFMLYNHIRSGHIRNVLKDVELRAFLIIIAGGIIISTLVLIQYSNESLYDAFRDSFFQIISMATTTGYVRSPYTIWPVTCQMILLMLMFIGGCGGSTSGSIKVIRIVVMLKLIVRGSYKRIHPRSVVPIRVGEQVIPAPVVSGISGFIMTYLAIFLASSIILGIQGLDMETTMGTALAMLSNTGAAFGVSTAAGCFAVYSPGLKLFLCLLMFIGRLEIFTMLVMFTRQFWGKSR